ncbi:MAG: mercury methylation corrinoid protein HgcA [Spirochaetes bacterium]|nr:mercury methylation corrinoid protein HgcA [Spirochaetota bacterium]
MNFILKHSGKAEAQAGFIALEELRKPWVDRFMVYGGRTIPAVSTTLHAADRLGALKARWDIGRMRYSVLPGLYAVGKPTSDSPVFVTANYKMSFDALRSNLAKLDGWILVLDTKGINVWCAAGKGTFGTAELVSRIAKVKLATIVTHRRVILPQLGASGVSAPEAARQSGFHVEWGPVRASDIPAWLAAGGRKSDAMREARFDLRDRIAVAPVEIVHAWPIVPAAIALAAVFGLPAEGWLTRAIPAAVLLLGTIPIGTVAFPALLPWLPSRAFAVKGAFLGAFWAALCAIVFHLPTAAAAGAILTAAPVVAFLGMNFTGASTFTCQPGALLEVEKGFWPMISSLIAGLAAAGASRIFGL